MDKVQCKGDSLLVVGDLNVWMDVQEDKQTIELSTLMNAHGLSQVVHEPTHRGGHILDHVYVNEHQLELKHIVMDEIIGLTTDHFPVIIDIPSANTKVTNKSIFYRKTKDMDMNSFKEDLQNAYNSMMDSEQGFAQNYAEFDRLSRSVMDKHAPVVSRKVKTGEAAWIDQEYRTNRALRRKCERNWRKKRTEESRNEYIQQKKVCVEMALSKQTLYYTKMVDGANDCQKSLFKIANELLDKRSEKLLPV